MIPELASRLVVALVLVPCTNGGQKTASPDVTIDLDDHSQPMDLLDLRHLESNHPHVVDLDRLGLAKASWAHIFAEPGPGSTWLWHRVQLYE